MSSVERLGGSSEPGESDGPTSREEREAVGAGAGAEAEERRSAAQGDAAAAGERGGDQTTQPGHIVYHIIHTHTVGGVAQW